MPFFPQTALQCGPAALATLLTYAGVPVTPEALAEDVYIPQRGGSLQLELMAASRRHGRFPYALETRPELLTAELRGGRPVLVLQNYGLGPISVWHYAVLVGFDPATQRFVLRSGRRQRHQESARRFLRTWSRAGNWALLVLRPGEIPATATPQRYLRAVIDAAGFVSARDVSVSLQAALDTWPEHPEILFAAANDAFASGALAKAQTLFTRLTVREPEHVAGLNNLANVLAARGCTKAARHVVHRALSLGPGTPFMAAIEDTAAGLPSTDGAQPGHCPAEH